MTGDVDNRIALGVAADLLAAIDFPATTIAANALGAALLKLGESRRERARKIAIDSLRRSGGRILRVGEGDEFVAIFHRYMRAATEGAAALNLRLMAEVMAGQIAADALYASDFQQYADTISGMRREEIVYLGTMVRLVRTGVRRSHPLDNFHSLEHAVAAELRRQLVPSSHFPTEKEFLACETALQRTGLVYRHASTLDSSAEMLALSPSGHALANLADLEAAVADLI